jgi:uncharacterized protein
VIRRLGSQVRWNNLAAELTIDHPATVAGYVAILERMDVIGVVPALVEDKLAGAPKKARKVIVRDPFVLYALQGWLKRNTDPFGGSCVPLWTLTLFLTGMFADEVRGQGYSELLVEALDEVGR